MTGKTYVKSNNKCGALLLIAHTGRGCGMKILPAAPVSSVCLRQLLFGTFVFRGRKGRSLGPATCLVILLVCRQDVEVEGWSRGLAGACSKRVGWGCTAVSLTLLERLPRDNRVQYVSI